jgi:hypothetical protein
VSMVRVVWKGEARAFLARFSESWFAICWNAHAFFASCIHSGSMQGTTHGHVCMCMWVCMWACDCGCALDYYYLAATCNLDRLDGVRGECKQNRPT